MNWVGITTLLLAFSLLLDFEFMSESQTDNSQGQREEVLMQSLDESQTEVVRQIIPKEGGDVRTPTGAIFRIKDGVLTQDTELTLKLFNTPHPKTSSKIEPIGPLVQVEISFVALNIDESELFYIYSPPNEEGKKLSDLIVEVRVELPNGKSILYLENYYRATTMTRITSHMLKDAYLGNYPETVTVSVQPVDIQKVIQDY